MVLFEGESDRYRKLKTMNSNEVVRCGLTGLAALLMVVAFSAAKFGETVMEFLLYLFVALVLWILFLWLLYKFSEFLGKTVFK